MSEPASEPMSTAPAPTDQAAPGSKPSRHRRRSRGASARGDLWRPTPKLPDPEPITPGADPTALLRSLGDPPLLGQGAVAEHYVAAVTERVAALATALAVAGGLLAEPDDS
ncbi:hypothetical protein BH18ACT1_BH18ACT1_18010 [soil metagenome]